MTKVLPETFKRLIVTKLTSDFRDAVSLEEVNWRDPEQDEVCIKNRYVGIAAGDMNTTQGKTVRAGTEPPFTIGFMGVGEIAEIGSAVCSQFCKGQFVVYYTMKYNAYAEYSCVPVGGVTIIPNLDPRYLAYVILHTTVVPAFSMCKDLSENDPVLITSAAGSTGHLAVQWAKHLGYHVVGTCSTETKSYVLKKIGCDRVITYKTENLEKVLQTEYKTGLRMIWETVGGSFFKTCLKNISYGGQLLFIGFTSLYKKESNDDVICKVDLEFLYKQVISKAVTIIGFHGLKNTKSTSFSIHDFRSALENGTINVILDNGAMSIGKKFHGMNAIADAAGHLQSSKSIGTVVVEI